MNKSTAMLVVISLALAGSTLYFQSRYQSAVQRIESLQQDHATQTARLSADYQAEIRELEQYILNQYRRQPGTGGDSPPPVRPNLDETLVEPVERKYRYLLADMADETTREALRQLLLEREDAATTPTGHPDYEARLAEIDVRIGEFLDAEEYQQYSALKKSDVEQHHLNIYARGISHLAPLDPDQHRALLLAKLRHKKTFEAVLRDSGLQQDRLSQTEREYAHRVIEQALQQYKHDYLEEAKLLLEEEQFILLNNYETTEFNLELERLQAQINAKM